MYVFTYQYVLLYMDMTLHESKQLLHYNTFPNLLQTSLRFEVAFDGTLLHGCPAQLAPKAERPRFDDATPCWNSQTKQVHEMFGFGTFQVVTCGEFVVWAQASGSDDLRGSPSFMKKWVPNEWFQECRATSWGQQQQNMEMSKVGFVLFFVKLWVVDIQQLNTQKTGDFLKSSWGFIGRLWQQWRLKCLLVIAMVIEWSTHVDSMNRVSNENFSVQVVEGRTTEERT